MSDLRSIDSQSDPEPLRFGPFEYNFGTLLLLRDGSRVSEARGQALDGLDYVLRNRNRLVTYDDLIVALWGEEELKRTKKGDLGAKSSKDVLKRLRPIFKILAYAGHRFVEVVDGRGFRFVPIRELPVISIEQRPDKTRSDLARSEKEVGETLSATLVPKGSSSAATMHSHLEDATTRHFANTFNAGDHRIIGSVIETHTHPNLESGLALPEIGWAESEVSLRLQPGSFRTEPLLSDPFVSNALEQREAENRRDGKPSILTPPDGVKYAVVDASSPFLDVFDFSVTVQETRYFSIMSARPAVESSLLLRTKFGHVDPHKNQIPHALGLQFIALFSDNNVLAIQRAKDTFPFPGTWSFSGEEQCAPIDLSWSEKDRMRNYMLRTVVEEVFPLARIPDPVRLIHVMGEAHQYVGDMRIVGLLLEEPIVTFSFFVIFRLKLDVKEYASKVIDLVRTARGQMSREGRYFSVAVSDLPSLLEGRNVEARPIFGNLDVSIAPSKLHPTSRYRLTRFLDILSARG